MPINKADFDQLMNQARVRLTGAADAGLKAELYDTLSEFFNDSSIWTQDIPVSAIPTSTSYPLQVNEGLILRLVGVVTSQGSPVSALMPEIGRLILKHAPNTAETYSATVVTNIALPTDKNMVPLMPDWVLPVWHVGILDGLLGRMMSQPAKSYANKDQSVYHLRRFRDAIARARVSKLRANTVGSQAWRFPQGFRTSGQQGGVPANGGGSERSF